MNMNNRAAWLKHKKLSWWRFNKYSIESEYGEFICRFGHVEIGRTKSGDEARQLCGLHAGALE